MKKITIHLTDEQHRRLKELAERELRSMQKQVVALIEQATKKGNKETQ